jgi:hypothetical protein
VTVAGDPFHDVINARKLVSPQCNDAVDFLHDHQELLCRLSAPAQPEAQGEQPAPPELSPAGRQLLLQGIALPVPDFTAALQKDEDGAASLRAFLSSPAVRRAKSVWEAVCAAQPPRPVIARLARRADCDLHGSLGWLNYRGKKDFVAEVRLMRKWYRMAGPICCPFGVAFRLRSRASVTRQGG